MGNHTATRARGRSSSGGAAPSSVAALHERSARLQREGGLAREVQPGENIAPRQTVPFGEEGKIYGAADPAAIVRGYSEDQTGAVLSRFGSAELRGMAQQQGLPTNGTKAEVVSRLTASATEGRYSANFGASKGVAVSRTTSTGPTTPREREAESRAKAAESRATAAERRAARLERQLATLQAQHEALKARVAGGSGRGGASKRASGLSEKNQAALNGPAPVPIAGDWTTFSPSARFDPYRRVVEYGQHQLRAVLARATQVRLREGAKIVMERNPGTKPTSLSSTAAMIDYIMEHVAPGY